MKGSPRVAPARRWSRPFSTTGPIRSGRPRRTWPPAASPCVDERVMTAPGGWLVDTAGLYGRVFRRGAMLAARNWQLACVIAASLEVLALGLPWLARLGIVGGLLVTLAMTACTSAALELAGESIRGGRTKWGEGPGEVGTFPGRLRSRRR